MGKEMRKYTKGKGLKWKKGESSSSNPTTRTYRSAAKGSFFQYKLAQEADTRRPGLASVSAGNNSDSMADSQSHSSRVTVETFKTDVSAWTQCSITSFGRLQSIWSADSKLHREMLAILAAITEVIKERNGQESETEYFAALLTTLDTVESVDSRTAVLSLLGLLIKRVPANVLRKQGAHVMKPLVQMLSDNVQSENNSLMRSVLKILSAVLRVQDTASWKDASTAAVFRTMLSLINHHKPKVRKQCHSSVCSVLKGSDVMTGTQPMAVHPMAVMTANFCIQAIQDSNATKDHSVILHVLGLLKDILADFPEDEMKAAVEAIFDCMQVSSPLVRTVGLKAINGLFIAQPDSSRLSAEVNALIISALYAKKPAEGDTQLVLPWLETTKQAYLNLYRQDQRTFFVHLEKLSADCMKLLLVDRPEIRAASAAVLKEIVTTCLSAVGAQREAYQQHLVPIQKFFQHLEVGLTYQYHLVWNMVLEILTEFYEACGAQASNFTVKSLEKVALLRDSPQFPFTAELDRAFGRAVRKVGAPRVLRIVPLKINVAMTPMDLSRSWMIPLLRDYVQDTELGFFISFFLPLASQLRSKSAMLTAAGEPSEAKSCDILQRQIWSILPGFCTRPTDLVESLRGIAKILGQALDERPDLQLDVMAALRALVLKNMENDVNRTEVAKYAKNYLPRLLQIYTTEATSDGSNQRLAALETVKIYLKITPQETIDELFEKVVEKLNGDESSQFLLQACVDVAAVLLPYVPIAKLDGVLAFCRTAWVSPDATLQKKGYRCFGELLLSDQEALQAYAAGHMDTFKTDFTQAYSETKPPAKAARLRCLSAMVKRSGLTDKSFLKVVFPEIVMCTKEISENARQSAFELVKEVGNILLSDSSRPEEENVAEYFELMLSGLAGTPDGVAASIVALSHAVYEFRDKLRKPMVDMLMDNMNVLLASNTRDIVTAIFGFFKVIFSRMADFELGPHVARLVKSVSGMEENFRRHFRVKIRDLFTVLIRKFGYTMIVELVPESDHKLINNIRKTQEREKRQKKEKRNDKKSIAGDGGGDGGEEDVDRKSRAGAASIGGRSRAETINDILDELASSDEDGGTADDKRREKKKKGNVYITEEDDEEIVDFTDPRASQKISSTMPSKSKRKQLDVRVAPDGRIIIDAGGHDRDDDAASLSSRMSGVSLNDKKKGKNRSEDTDGDDDGSFGYQAGGSGIHRPLKSSRKEKPAKKVATGAEYRAKKAGGDVKLKGRPDPYAYIPLDLKSSNKRKKAKLVGQFKGFVKGAKKGAMKGSKDSKSRKRNFQT
ncbi:RRP12-like protein [Hypsibius exemplaris]|uniref:RRP12-like protein n=1 Tax=Hypsibius exemplaris TaxID=2072580 RepID=A0A9X6RMM7_HYPEX|nr:RRP12-like protein [Hypsibius exemplaris]